MLIALALCAPATACSSPDAHSSEPDAWMTEVDMNTAEPDQPEPDCADDATCPPACSPGDPDCEISDELQRCYESHECPQNYACVGPGGRCKAPGEEGVCLWSNEACDQDEPACGCDGQTYANRGQALRAGVGVSASWRVRQTSAAHRRPLAALMEARSANAARVDLRANVSGCRMAGALM